MNPDHNIYAILKTQVKSEKPLTADEKRSCINMISKLDNEGHQFIFIIINSYNRDNSLEYSGMTVKLDEKFSDIKFNLSELSGGLQQMIYKFSSMHTAKMVEEKERNVGF
jgi:hypothetical protein